MRFMAPYPPCTGWGGHLQEPQGFDGEPPSWEGQTAFVAVLQAFQLQEGQPHLGEGQGRMKSPVHPSYTTTGVLTWSRGAPQAPACPEPSPAFNNSTV